MSVTRAKNDAAPTPNSAYAEWRFSLHFQTCPSLEEAYVAGWRACPTGEDTAREDAYASGMRAGRKAGYDAGIAAAVRRALEREREQATDPRVVLARLGLSEVRWSHREAQVMGLLGSLNDGSVDARLIRRSVWGDDGAANAPRVVLARIRAKLPKDWCIGTTVLFGYRLHRIGITADCELWRGGGGIAPGTYTPRCRQARQAMAS